MAISRISSQDAIASTNTGGSITATYPAATTAGNLLIAVTCAPAAQGTMKITTGGAWTYVMDVSFASGGANDVAMFAKIATGTETTITATGGTTGICIDVFEYTGNNNPLIIDAACGNGLNNIVAAPPTTTATILTTNPNVLVLSVVGFRTSNASAASWTSSTAIGLNQTGANGAGLLVGERIVSAVGSYQDSATWTGSSVVGTLIAAFAASGSIATKSPYVINNFNFPRGQNGISVTEKIR